MYIFQYKFAFFTCIVFSSSLFSNVYENAEDKKIDKWSILQPNINSHILNTYNKDKKSHVIQFKGEGTRSTYLLKLKKNYSHKSKTLSWEMNYAEDFVIMIQLNTNKGKYTLLYTPGNADSYLQYGLGNTSTLGQWKKYTRDLQKDLNNFLPNSKIFTLDNFVIRGSGFIDNIKILIPEKNISQNIIKKTQDEIQKKVFCTTKNKDNIPSLQIYGKNPIILKKGEPYIEEGVKAIDTNGYELPVTSTHQIDIFKEGEYSVIYIATNSIGNSVVDKRQVIIGDISKIKETNDITSNPSIELEECQENLYEWKQKLIEQEEEYTENELITQVTIEKNSTNQKLIDYPARPGL